MNKLSQIITETINNYLSNNNSLLYEYHHAYDNGLYQDAINIGNEIIKNRINGWNDENTPIKYETNSFGEEIIINIYLTDSNVNQYHAYSAIKISKQTVDDAIETNDNSRLLSAIYHELGHMTNVKKSNDNLSQIRTDLYEPLFIKLPQEEYRNMTKILYRFRKSEMKARCFETTMLLRQNPNLSLQDVYDNRCSNITLMRNFIQYLTSNGNNDEKYTYIITELYKSIAKKVFFKEKPTIESMKKKVVTYFNNKLQWLKNRIDKIYYDNKRLP